MAAAAGVEPATCSLGESRSIQLSYATASSVDPACKGKSAALRHPAMNRTVPAVGGKRFSFVMHSHRASCRPGRFQPASQSARTDRMRRTGGERKAENSAFSGIRPPGDLRKLTQYTIARFRRKSSVDAGNNTASRIICGAGA